MPKIGILRSLSFNIPILEITIKIQKYIHSPLLLDHMDGNSALFSALSVSSTFTWKLQTDPTSFRF